MLKVKASGISWLMLILLSTSCSKKVADQGFGGGPWSHSSQLVSEKLYHPRPMPTAIYRMNRTNGLNTGIFDTVPPRRVTLNWLASDSINPSLFKGSAVQHQIAKSRQLLKEAEAAEADVKQHDYKLWRNLFWIAFLTSGLIPGMFLAATIFLIIYLIEFSQSGRHLRKKAARLIRRAPFAMGSSDYRSGNVLQSVYLLRYYMPAYRMRRKLNKYGPEIISHGTAEENRRFSYLRQAAETRTQAEKSRAAQRTIKVIAIVAAALALMSLLVIQFMETYTVGFSGW